MCQIVVEPAGLMLPKDCHEKSFTSNDDGFGYMYAENGRVVAFKQVGLSKTKILKLIRANKKRLFISHMRYRTSGAVSQDLCHPFRVLHKDRDGKDLFFMHNGVISWVVPRGTESDTVAFVNRYLRPILKADPDFLYTDEFKKYIESLIGIHNKLCFLDGDGNVIRTGSWTEHNGCFMSNAAYRPVEYKAPTYYTYPSYTNSTHAYNCECFTCNRDLPYYSSKSNTTLTSKLTKWRQHYDTSKEYDDGVDYESNSAVSQASTSTALTTIQSTSKEKEEEESFIPAKEAELVELDSVMRNWHSVPYDQKEEIVNSLDVRNIYKYKRFPNIWKTLGDHYTTYAKNKLYPDYLVSKNRSEIKNWVFNKPWHTIWAYMWLFHDGSCKPTELNNVFYTKGVTIFQQNNVRYKEPIVYAINYHKFFELFYNDIFAYAGADDEDKTYQPLTAQQGV